MKMKMKEEKEEDRRNLLMLAECACNVSRGKWLATMLQLGAQALQPVCHKTLTPSDTEPHLNRLALPKTQVNNQIFPLLTEAEIRRVEEEGGLELCAFDKEGRAWNLIFKYWKSSQTYVLIDEWMGMVVRNGWRSHTDALTVWCFRHGFNGSLCFVILNH
ncbi:hypothetical protein AMTRI_Chr08g206250 [Amborella trichopoda]|uniref:TF-B3 domain-containing protein n=1 Tax=Amborella trichopoda TaxID=13333 RepID=W1P4X4_AMBTC|nr:hypothetical protein AMTR_s00080p00130620 [Amborella trichopoda]